MPSQPAPVVVAPSGLFDGIDGNWSTFQVRLGNPAVDVRLLPSTLLPYTVAVGPGGCDLNSPSNCYATRGEPFPYMQSQTWVGEGEWSLDIELGLGIVPSTNTTLEAEEEAGNFGYDTLGVSMPSGSITVDDQVIAAINFTGLYVGLLGLAAETSNFDNTNTKPSWLASLKNSSIIPSLSYAYTAGAFYRNKIAASLTLGGFDSSKFISNDVSFELQSVPNRDLQVGIQSISFTNSSLSPRTLWDDGIMTFIDSTVSTIWLPLNACDQIALNFGLEFNSLTLLYTISDAAHQQNINSKANITFNLGTSPAGGETVPITLPYSAFDVTYEPPLLSSSQRIFPLRQAQSPSQYTLGRTFLQEAYLIVDYEQGNFSVSQADFSGNPSHIVPIQAQSSSSTTPGSPSSSSSTSPGPLSSGPSDSSKGSSGLSTGATAGIAIGVVLLASIAAGIFILFYCRRRRRHRADEAERQRLEEQRQAEAAQQYADLPPELGGGKQMHATPEVTDMNYYSHDKYALGQQHLGEKAIPGVMVSNELDGVQVSSPPQRHTSLNRHGGPVELAGQELERAELHSPEPDSQSTLGNPVGSTRGRSVSPSSRLSSEPWGVAGTNLEPGSPTSINHPRPDLAHRVSAGTTASRPPLGHHPSNSAVSASSMQHGTAFPFPSPEEEAANPLGGNHVNGTGVTSASAFTSPQIGYTRWNDDITTPPPLSPAEPVYGHRHGAATPETRETDTFLQDHLQR